MAAVRTTVIPGDPGTSMRSRADRWGALLLVICALGAVVAAASAVPDVRAADPSTQGAEAWRMIGYLMFAGVFTLLAREPHRLRGLFELTIAAKLALPIAALTVARDADDATAFLVGDGIVAALLIGAYLLVRGWRSVLPNPCPCDKQQPNGRLTSTTT